MDIKAIENGDFLCLSRTEGYAPNEKEKIVEVNFDVVKVEGFDSNRVLVRLSNSPEVYVYPQYLHGIALSDTVLKRLGWDIVPIDDFNCKYLSEDRSILKAFNGHGIRIYKDSDQRYFIFHSASRSVDKIEYVHELQKYVKLSNPTLLL